MKILITSDTYSPMVNGVVTSTMNLYNELRKQGHDVRILTLSSNGKSYVNDNVYFLKSIAIKVYPGARIGATIKDSLIKDIIQWKPDIVHSQTEFTTLIYARYIVKKLSIPHVHTYHTMYEDYLKYLFKGKLITKENLRKIVKRILNKVDLVITPTIKVKETLISYGVYTHISVVPTGIDLSRFMVDLLDAEKEKLKEKLHIHKEDKVIVYVGRIGEEKNIEEVINNFAELVKVDQKVKLVIVGGGPYLEVLRKVALENKVDDKIIFTGMIGPTEIYKYYKVGDVFVTASTSETQGLTYIEALSCGVPVLCKYDQCIDNVIINDHNGFAYNTKDEFVEEALKILNDVAYRNELSQNAISKAKEYSKEVFGNKICKQYEMVQVLKAPLTK
ncbi:glycosyltransferase family 4 protein [Clostridium sp. UBA4548]|uniref:glycosyltransferase family 4 protein n=1 Tax=Clostridium sp. UBA4548 TaxID=1946361 RepID=UPI0025BEC6A6|nr:glycosyltransferase family 4 protein [Clostridium sp. UBA4548]